MKTNTRSFLLPLVWMAGAGLSAAVQPAPDPWEPRLLEGRMDGLIEAQRQAHHIAGAVARRISSSIRRISGRTSR